MGYILINEETGERTKYGKNVFRISFAIVYITGAIFGAIIVHYHLI